MRAPCSGGTGREAANVMRDIAEYLMQSRARALGACAIFGILPFVHWIGVVIVALIVMRRGVNEGLLAFACTGVPLLVWYLANPLSASGVADPTAIMSLIGTAALALVLRTSMSWEVTLGAAVLAGTVFGLGFEYFAGDLLGELVKLFMKLPKMVSQGVTSSEARQLLVGYVAMGQAYGMIGQLVLARWWQSLLYNPGGFQKEFHALRLPKALGMGLLILMLAAMLTRQVVYLRWLPLLTLPMFVCAIGFVHWYVKYKKMDVGWLVGFYILLVLMSEWLYPLMGSLALVDSWVDLRRRIGTDRPDNEV